MFRSQIADAFSKKLDEMDHKFSVEIAKLQALIETELGMQDENEIMDEDESDSQSSLSSP